MERQKDRWWQKDCKMDERRERGKERGKERSERDPQISLWLFRDLGLTLIWS